MASRSFELEPAERIGVATLGEPGSRQFFLHVEGAGQQVTLACEKFHIEGLVTRVKQLLEANGLDPAPAAAAGPREPAPEPDWPVAELGLGFHEGRRQFVIVAREMVASPEEEAATARFWADPEAIRGFLGEATQVLAQGRPTCARCGLPIDPAGHPCPALNGSRPIF